MLHYIQMLHRAIVFVNCALGIASLSIQIAILVPWHDIIAEQIENLTVQQNNLEKKMNEMKALTERNNALLAGRGKKWFSWF